jgi:PAS domain S-box-containing protein
MLGRPAAEVVGRSFAEFVHPDHRAEAADHLARRRAGSPERHDFRFVRADGSDLWALVSLGAVLDDEGGWTGALAMVTDVTDRRRAEESLRFLADAGRVLARSLDHDTVLREIAQLTVPRLADLCVVLLEPDGAGAPAAWHAAHRDPSKLPLLREALESGIARPEPEGFLAAARRERRALLVEEVTPETLGRFIQGAETLRLSAALEPRSLVSVPLAVEDRSVGVMLLATTDPARRLAPADAGLAEELARRAAAAVENARLHAAEHDARRAAERSAGWISRLQAVTAALSEARTPEEVGQAVLAQTMPAMGAAAGWVGQLDGGGTRIDLAAAVGFPDSVVQEFRSVPLDAPISLAEAVRTGQIVCIENRAELERRYPGVEDRGQRARFGAWAVAPLWVEGRPVGGLVLNFADERRFDDDTRAYLLAVGRQSALAMERARLYDAERRARAEAEEANRAKFEFLTTMSHELRTPLNAIAGYVDLLELEIRGPITAEQRSDLARIRRSQTHLLGLINDVLNFARIETGHVNFTLQDLPADEVLAEVEPLIAPQVAARGVTYEHRCPAPVPVLHADPEKLRQILLNLLSNAVKFTPAGGRITLVCDEDAGVVRFRVEDTGIGIPADKLSSIFEPFVQVNAGYTRTSEGTGLGLSISRDLARAMGGELTAESVEGEGSVFTLILPRGTAGS